MMGGREINDRGVAFSEHIGAQTALVERDRPQSGAVLRDDLRELAVARVLDRIHMPVTEQLNEQADQIFQTRAHDDILRRDRDAAEIMQIVRNLLPQLKQYSLSTRRDRCAQVENGKQPLSTIFVLKS